MIRIANLYDLFERSSAASDEVILDYFRINIDDENIKDLSADVSLIADDDYIRQVVESGNYEKNEIDTKFDT